MSTITTTASTPEEEPRDEFTIDQCAKVYLVRDPQNRRWVIDPFTFDGAPLEGYDAPDSDLDRRFWTEKQHRDVAVAAEDHLPTGEELTLMLLAALPAQSATRAAMTDSAGTSGIRSRLRRSLRRLSERITPETPLEEIVGEIEALKARAHGYLLQVTTRKAEG